MEGETQTPAELVWWLVTPQFTAGGTLANKPSTSMMSLPSCVACRLISVNGMKNAVEYKKTI
jgi:hypothetical protein